MSDSPIFRFDSPDSSPGFLLWLLTNIWQRQQRAALKTYDLTHGQFVLLAGLAWLEQSQEIITQIDLANHTGIDVMMTSDLIRKLEAKKLLVRNPHPSDSRAKILRLTPQGRDLVKITVSTVEQVDEDFFGVLGDDLPQFVATLQKLLTQNLR